MPLNQPPPPPYIPFLSPNHIKQPHLNNHIDYVNSNTIVVGPNHIIDCVNNEQ
jgi:hypothetical protein